jgi:type I restriction enzyme S subunit
VPYCEISDSDSKKYKLESGDVVIARTGATTGATYTMKPRDPNNVVFASYLIRYRIDKSIADPFFVDFCLSSSFWKSYVEGVAGGSAQPGANAKQLASFEISLPEQKAIASVLSSLDDKIDLLHRQNKTLESIAETLFRQWFIEEAQDDWEEKPLSYFGDIICGKTPSKKKTEYFNGSVPFIKIPDMHGNTYITNTIDTLTEEGRTSQTNKTIPPFSVCVSCIATVGLVSINAIESQTNQQINTIVPSKEIYRYYLFLYMKNSFDLLQAMGSGGTATLNINTSSFSKMDIEKPDDLILENFSNEVKPMFNKILSNQTQIKTLEHLRDTLLPKLMSGDVRVEYEVEA